MLAKMDANQTRMKAMKEEMDAYQAKTDADREADLENLQEMMKASQEDITYGQAEMRSAIGAIEEKMDAWIANVKDDRKETTACQYAMETILKNLGQIREKRRT
jgi:chromosome segregation ATPase